MRKDECVSMRVEGEGVRMRDGVRRVTVRGVGG